MKRALLVATALVLAGCETLPPVAPGPGLADAPAWAMKRPLGPQPIPERDGDPAIRRDFLAFERQNHAQCVDRHGALVLYIRKVRSPSS